eukprot:7797367-Pyramimonas_sp.AAC.1
MPGGDRSRTPVGPRRWNPTSEAEREAGSALLEQLLSLYASCRITAKDLATLRWHCSGAKVP